MQKNRRELSILKQMIWLSLPTIAEEILAALVQYVDTAMVGQLGEKATAAVSVTTSVTWLIGSPMGAFAVGILALTARALGEKNREKVRELSYLAVWAVLLLGIAEGAVTLGLSGKIPVWMGAEADIQPLASAYFAIICAPMIFRTSISIFGGMVRGMGDTKTPMYITFAMNLMNVILNYLLIYVCGMGVTGAAVATAISCTAGGIGMWLVFRKKTREYAPRIWGRAQATAVRSCLQISIPSAMTRILSCMGYVVFSGLVARMGTVTFAAHAIAVSAETIFYTAGYGLNTAVATMVGFALGERSREKFYSVVKMGVAVTIAMMICSGTILYLVAEPLMAIFTPNREVILLGAKMLRLVALSEPFFGMMILMQGVYNGLGKTKDTFVIEVIGMWGVRILFSFFCVQVWHLDLRAVWYCMIADNVVKATLFVLHYLHMKKRNLFGI